MKTIRVVAAVIRKDDRILPHSEVMGNLRTGGNFPVERLNPERLRSRR